MATIVRHKESGERYILLGAGLGAYRATRPGVFWGNLGPVKESGEICAVYVCDARGVTGWIESSSLEVLSVDGQMPGDVLGEPLDQKDEE